MKLLTTRIRVVEAPVMCCQCFTRRVERRRQTCPACVAIIANRQPGSIAGARTAVLLYGLIYAIGAAVIALLVLIAGEI